MSLLFTTDTSSASPPSPMSSRRTSSYQGGAAPPPPRYNNSRRAELKKIAGETVAALKSGTYSARGIDYDLRRKINETKQNTRFYHPNDGRLANWAQSAIDGGTARQRRADAAPTYISVVKSTTLDALRSLEEVEGEKAGGIGRRRPGGSRMGVLSSGSPGQPGGNFLAGDEGQELSLSRSSTLFASLTSDEGRKFYSIPASPSTAARLGRTAAAGAFNTHAMVYSPGITVFRDDIGRYTQPLDIDVLTCAAVPAHTVRKLYANAAARAQNNPNPNASPAPPVPDARHVEAQIQRTMRERMARILFLFEERGIRTLILPAFGAGKFQNKVSAIARAWASLLTAPDARFGHSFDRVIFAIMPEAACQEFQRAFYRDVPRGVGNTDRHGDSRISANVQYPRLDGNPSENEDGDEDEKNEYVDAKREGKQRQEDSEDERALDGVSIRRTAPSAMENALSYASSQIRALSRSFGEGRD